MTREANPPWAIHSVPPPHRNRRLTWQFREIRIKWSSIRFNPYAREYLNMRRIAQHILTLLAISAFLSLPASAQTMTWSGPSLVFKPLEGSRCLFFVDKASLENGTMQFVVRNPAVYMARVSVYLQLQSQEGGQIKKRTDSGLFQIRSGLNTASVRTTFQNRGKSLTGSILTVEIKSCGPW